MTATRNGTSTLEPTQKSSGSAVRRALRVAAALLAVALATPALATGPVAAATVDAATMALDTSYRLKTTLSYATGAISASETIRLTNRSRSAISKLNLSVMPHAFGELTAIGSLRVDGQPVPWAWTNNANLELQLGKVLEPGQSAVVTLSFRLQATGTIGTSLEGRLSKANGIMQVSHWFPIVSNGHPMRYPGDSQYTRTARRIRLELTTDSTSVRIAAPGRLVSVSGRYHVYEMDYTRDFAFGASPYYRTVSGWSGGVNVIAYYTTGAGATALANARAALVRYESAYGQYQWPRYVIAQTGRPGSGNEFPGIVFLGGPVFSSRSVVAHETAHQWWYAMAGNDQLGEAWLDEGLAEFTADYFYGGFSTYDSWRPVNSTIYEFPNLPASYTSTEPGSYDQTIYHKSSRFLNALRSRMGTANFFNGLRALFAANRNGVVTSREFYDTMARYGAPTDYMRAFIRL